MYIRSAEDICKHVIVLSSRVSSVGLLPGILRKSAALNEILVDNKYVNSLWQTLHRDTHNLLRQTT